MVMKSFLLILLFFGFSFSQLSAALTGYLKIPDIPGESQAVGHEEEIDIHDISWGVFRPKEGDTGSTRTRSTAVFEDLIVIKELDKSSPKLMEACANGRVFPESLADFTYHLSILTGVGRGATSNDDSNLLYVGRLQWNMFGRELDMSGSDLAYHEKPTGLIALAGAMNKSPYTRFSQSGGGQLEGFEEGVPGQYNIKQALLETALKYRGFSWENEFHIKTVRDNVNNYNRTLKGYYFKAGYFFSNLFDFVPKPLEVAGVYTNFIPDANIQNSYERELGLAFNWFFKEHNNKLTMEFTNFNYNSPSSLNHEKFRFRIQWDISF